MPKTIIRRQIRLAQEHLTHVRNVLEITLDLATRHNVDPNCISAIETSLSKNKTEWHNLDNIARRLELTQAPHPH